MSAQSNMIKAMFNPLCFLEQLKVTKVTSILCVSSLLLLSFPIANNKLQAVQLKQSAGGRVTQNASVPSSFEDYRKECLRRATGQGLAQDIAQDLCGCTIKKFQSQYNFSQFRALVVQSKNDRTAAQRLTAVGEACFDEVLYE